MPITKNELISIIKPVSKINFFDIKNEKSADYIKFMEAIDKLEQLINKK